MSRKPKSQKFLDKSKEAANAAIGQYNHPHNSYRIEGFSILMINAWELILKAKTIKDNQEKIQSIYVVDKDKKRKDGKEYAKPKYKKTKYGTEETKGLAKLIKESNLDSDLEKQLECLIGIRNESVHSIYSNKEKTYLETFEATLRNYETFLNEEFDQLLNENLYLIPLAFNAVENFKISSNCNIRKLMEYIQDAHQKTSDDTKYKILISVDVKFNRSPDDGIILATKKEGGIPIMQDSEENFKNKYPWTYTEKLIPKLKEYKNFKQDNKFHETMKTLQEDKNFSDVRYLDWNKKSGTTKKFYSPNIIKKLVYELKLTK